MDTIYSEIIWNRLGKKDYQIHTEPYEQTLKLVTDYIKSLNSMEMENLLSDISGIEIDYKGDYYDGYFINISSSENNNILVHQSGIETFILQLIMTLGGTDLKFLENAIDIRKDYVNKLKQENRKDIFDRKEEV
jgi:hypothetical protein